MAMVERGHKLKPLSERFWGKVDKRSLDECWPWMAYRNSGGYGKIKVDGKCLSAHRISWILHFGPIPKGMCVLHHCDNPSCMNPYHLFIGSPADNAADRGAKGRGNQPRGEKKAGVKLTEEKVHMIRKSPLSQRKLAAMCDVTGATIWCIRHYRRWAWLKEEHNA